TSTQRLNRVSMRYKMQSGRLEVFLLNALPQNAADLSGPVDTVKDTAGNGKAALDFNPQGARYVALRWTSEAKVGDGKDFGSVDGKDFGSVTGSGAAAGNGAPAG